MLSAGRSVSRTLGHVQAAWDARASVASLLSMTDSHLAEWNAVRRPSPQVTQLLHRIRTLVAEQRRLSGRASGDRLEANKREISRLQSQLANVLRRELSEGVR
jgi:hypothetical protein